MIRIRLEGRPGVIETDSVAEAVRVYKELSNGARPSLAAAHATKAKPGGTMEAPVPARQLNPGSQRLLEELLKHENGIAGQDLARTLGIDVTALGVRVTNLAKWAGWRKDQLIEKGRVRDQEGSVQRTWKLSPKFVKHLRESELKETLKM